MGQAARRSGLDTEGKAGHTGITRVQVAREEGCRTLPTTAPGPVSFFRNALSFPPASNLLLLSCPNFVALCMWVGGFGP